MNDRDLRRALRDLPVPRAGDAFTRDVLRRLERVEAAGAQEGAPRQRLSPRLLAAAAALALVLGAAGAWRADERASRREEIRSLRAESSRLRGEIRALEDRLHDPATLLYVGGTETVDLVVDLSQLAGLTVGETRGEPAASPEPAAGGVL